MKLRYELGKTELGGRLFDVVVERYGRNVTLTGFWQGDETATFDLFELLREANLEVGLVESAQLSGKTRDKILRNKIRGDSGPCARDPLPQDDDGVELRMKRVRIQVWAADGVVLRDEVVTASLDAMVSVSVTPLGGRSEVTYLGLAR